jgi:hypothetical protein
MPNRYSDKALHRALEAGLGTLPVRRRVLDRWAQHTAICPDSLRAVARARLALKLAGFASLFSLLAAAAALGRAVGAAGGLQVALVTAALEQSKVAIAVAVAAGLAMVAASRFVAEFSFKYTEELRDRDLKSIPKVYPDTAAHSTAAPAAP